MDLRRASAVGAIGLLAALTTGCTSTVDAKQLESGVSAKIKADTGSKPSKLTCDELDATKGATSTCAMTLAGQEYEVTITVTGVRDGTVDYTVDPQPKTK